MSEFVFKLPDLGEGTVEAEIVQWHVKPGDAVAEGDLIVDVMTDKANVEVPAPVTGTILRTTGAPGDMVAVGAELVALETSAGAKDSVTQPEPEPTPSEHLQPAAEPQQPDTSELPSEEVLADAAEETADENKHESTDDVITTAAVPPTSPAIRRRAKEAGVDLARVQGSGPGGRILRRDFDAYLHGRPSAASTPLPAAAAGGVNEIKVIGVRRLIAQRLSVSASQIPHFAYVEEVDVTELSALRRALNERHDRHLTLLPFLALALLRALPAWPNANAHFDAENGMLKQYEAVHLGIATQTGEGLKVPVVRDAQQFDLWQLSDAIREAAAAAREGTATPASLSGSTITISSLGRLGGIVSTPIINHPETAIIGINKAVERPVVRDAQVQIRTIMNISGCFDHRFIDGADAAGLVADMKHLLEHPATLWLPDPA